MPDFQKVNFVSINIQILGGLKHNLNYKIIEGWKTSFFSIQSIAIINNLPDSEGKNWSYTDRQLERFIKKDDSVQITVALISHELQANYYGRRLSGNRYVLSFYETDEIILNADLKLEHFVIQNLYYISALYHIYNGKIPVSETDQTTHQDIRSCLFDFNAEKADLIYSLGKVSICNECQIKFDKKTVPTDFVEKIKSELKQIKKSQYYVIRDFIKRRPVLSIIIGIVFSLIINMISNFLYDIFFK